MTVVPAVAAAVELTDTEGDAVRVLVHPDSTPAPSVPAAATSSSRRLNICSSSSWSFAASLNSALSNAVGNLSSVVSAWTTER
jgi:hypothetical protein